ncbi:MAG TPA: putative molybdenum carrier protein [Syntrophorhabdaceae bacterium]|nr:putative molybdenum carrier protein [Pseudomonadota bacterium]HOF58861.1 putative molybdenum carrier protein [Syntrophorhabdaceae bacterium]HOS06347.1 putative molybdenum carrier protein [Syntrophorhabdaceae bacterium]HPL42029.1 putative molybdenum carrier protein [Syntrophorhabdaceae bacterium]
MKIISGAQTGVDRAAIDTAISLGLDYGGSVPQGRKAEDGPIDKKYDKLTELDTPNYKARTEKNVIDADATIILTIGRPTGGTAFTVACAKKHRKPYLIADLKDRSDRQIIESIRQWLSSNRFNTLNIAGPRESKSPGIYEMALNILKEALQ